MFRWIIGKRCLSFHVFGGMLFADLTFNVIIWHNFLTTLLSFMMYAVHMNHLVSAVLPVFSLGCMLCSDGWTRQRGIDSPRRERWGRERGGPPHWVTFNPTIGLCPFGPSVSSSLHLSSPFHFIPLFNLPTFRLAVPLLPFDSCLGGFKYMVTTVLRLQLSFDVRETVELGAQCTCSNAVEWRLVLYV
jgi:hypothetical protein